MDIFRFKHIVVFVILLQFHLYSVNFVLITQPKTGTHLLKPILTELTGKQPFRAQHLTHNLHQAWQISQENGTFIHFHSPHTPNIERFLTRKNCISFFVKRDPRDQIVSLLNHYKNISFIDKVVEAIPTDEERLLYMIRHNSKTDTIRYMQWLGSSHCCVLDFSKLMGDHGGAATHAEAIGELRKIANALQLDVSDSYLEEVYSNHFGKSHAFFRGKVGSWKDYFNNEHKEACKKAIGNLLIKLGYEKDFNW